MGRRFLPVPIALVAAGLLGAGMVAYAASQLSRQPCSGGQPSIPTVVGLPGPLSTPVGWSPIGAASILIADEAGSLFVAGLSDDEYRSVGGTADPGRTAILSDDGSMLALASSGGIEIVDLCAGTARSIGASSVDSDQLVPEAWLPDGSLVVLARSYAEDPLTEGTTHRLGIFDLVSGRYDVFASATFAIASTGFAVAASPDGHRIAYQYEQRLTIYDRRAGTKVGIELPPQAILAGKGAWDPDGSRVAVARFDSQLDRQWSLSFVDGSSAEAISGDRLVMHGAALIRVIGWDATTGVPVVVAYYAPYAPTWELAREIVITVTPDEITRLAVLQLNPQAAPTVLMQLPDGLTGIDISGSALQSGRFRPGFAPHPFSPLAVGVIGVAVLLGSTAGAAWLWRVRPRSAARRHAIVE